MNTTKTISEYNNQNKKFLNAMKAEGMKPAIDFTPSQRINAERNFKKSANEDIPSQGQAGQAKGFFKN